MVCVSRNVAQVRLRGAHEGGGRHPTRIGDRNASVFRKVELIVGVVVSNARDGDASTLRWVDLVVVGPTAIQLD